MGLVWKWKRNGVWYLEYAEELGGRKKSLKTGDERLAEAIRAKEENEILLSRYGIRYKPLHKIRYQEFASLFIAHKEAEGRAPNTIVAYAAALDNFGTFLGLSEWVHKIHRRQLEQYMGERRIAGRSNKTIRNELTILGLAFRWALSNGYLQENPYDGIELPRKVKRPPLYLQKDQYHKLMTATPEKQWRRIFDFYILTGCREEEGTRIRISEHLDVDARILRVPMSKPGDFKTIPVSDELMGVIRDLLRSANGSDTLIPFHPDTVYHYFKKYARDAGLPARMTVHTLRHTFGTWLGQRGVAGPNLQELLGHKDSKSTQIYVHPVRKELRREINKLKLPKRKTAKKLAERGTRKGGANRG